MSPRVGVVDYGLGNLPSVTKALERAGAAPRTVDRPAAFDGCDAIVLPGVGHFGTGMRNLRESNLDAALKDWTSAGRPLLGICLGLQLLFERSEEDPAERGLDILGGRVRTLRAPKVPHMGWNDVTAAAGAGVLSAVDGLKAYFVHSFYVETEASLVAATTTYGDTTFCSAVEAGRVVGVQFHPEKSSDVGRLLLERWTAEVA